MSKFWKDSVVIFLAGAVLSAGLGLIVDVSANQYVGLFSVFLSLLIIYTIAVVRGIQSSINRSVDLFKLRSAWIQEPTSGATEGYGKCKEIVLSAKKSILVLSHYSSSENPVTFPDSRGGYLFDGIESILKTRLREKDSYFLYQRLVQIDAFDIFDGILNNDYTGDAQMISHVQNIFQIVKDVPSENAHVDVRACRPIHSFPSMILVDDIYAIIALSTKSSSTESHDHFSLNGLFFIEDHEGRTIQGFKTIFSRFEQGSKAINETKSQSED